MKVAGMMVFCTLFDSNYLDKGILLYRSLEKACSGFKIYVLAMDDRCEEILKDYAFPNACVIHLNDFIEAFDLAEVQKSRSRGEFCWTCTAFLIDYVLELYGEKNCTYIDADMYFYTDPQCLLDEMGEKTIQIAEHRFNRSIDGRLAELDSGKYCVEFNTFKATSDALEMLHWWMERCFESCSNDYGGQKIFGEQGYLATWGEKPNVSVLQNLGGGVAPWNLAQYRLYEKEPVIQLKEKRTGKAFPLVFYHFHFIEYLDEQTASVHVFEPWKADRELVATLYVDYLQSVDAVKNELREKYGFYPLLKVHPGQKQAEDASRCNRKSLIKRIKSFNKVSLYRLYDRKVNLKKRRHYLYLNKVQFGDKTEKTE